MPRSSLTFVSRVVDLDGAVTVQGVVGARADQSLLVCLWRKRKRVQKDMRIGGRGPVRGSIKKKRTARAALTIRKARLSAISYLCKRMGLHSERYCEWA
jgi:hypothetical protein